MSKKNDGFILADCLLALVIMVMVLRFFCAGEQQLNSETQHAKEELKLARMAKEATDQLAISGQRIERRVGSYQIVATKEITRVFDGKKVVLTVERQ